MIVPTGTLNHFARDVGVYDLQEAIDATHAGEAVSVEDFGASGDGQEVLAACGITVEAVVAAALRALARATGAARTAHAEPTVAARTD